MDYLFIFVLLGSFVTVSCKAETGLASWYGPGFHGKLMANGERYNMYATTVAHKSLPLGSFVKVVSTKRGRSIIAKVTDRGPYKANRIVDLSYGAAKKLGVIDKGLECVKVERL